MGKVFNVFLMFISCFARDILCLLSLFMHGVGIFGSQLIIGHFVYLG